MTKAMTKEGWAYVRIVNDWFTKKILGVSVSARSRAAEWLEALNQAVCRQFPTGIREAEHLALNLMSDNGAQPTSVKFMRARGDAWHPSSVYQLLSSERQCRYRAVDSHHQRRTDLVTRVDIS